MVCSFRDLEFVDGYFSGTMEIQPSEDRYVFSFGYDLELGTLNLFNCKALLVSRGFVLFEAFDSSELLYLFGPYIKEIILHKLYSMHGRFKSFEEYEAEAFE